MAKIFFGFGNKKKNPFEQMTEEEFRSRTSFTIDNSGSPEKTEQQIRERMQKL